VGVQVSGCYEVRAKFIAPCAKVWEKRLKAIAPRED
jgi:hypothetical protein